jgi:hypothetical protein
MKRYTYIPSDQYYLHEDELKASSFFSENKPVDLNGASVYEKVGNSLQEDPKMVAETQTSIRTRFGLLSKADFIQDDLNSTDY